MPAEAVAPDRPTPCSADGVGGESLLDARGDRAGLVAIGAREHADELVGPETGCAVLATEDGAQHPGECLEELIAGVMAPAVVEIAESIDVGHDQREGPLTSRRAGELLVDDRKQLRAHGHPGDRVELSTAHLLLVPAGALDRPSRFIGERFDDRCIRLVPGVLLAFGREQDGADRGCHRSAVGHRSPIG